MPKSIAFNMSAKLTLPTKCRGFKTRQYDENDNDEQTQPFE